MNRQALKRKKKMLKIKYPSTLISVSNLALMLRNQKKYKTAEKMNRRILKKREKILKMKYSFILISVNNLARILQDQGKYKKIENCIDKH
jgi:hypothetical protein